ncbi:MAG: ribosome small subunit-dependent GTPase A, partial [Antricoccus sp.]
YTCIVDLDHSAERTITAMRARELGRKSVVVGDSVAIVGDATGSIGSMARIVRINPRGSELRRSADDTSADRIERVIVANAADLVVVCAATNPTPRYGFIDRALVAAYAGHLRPVLCMTKTDLIDPTEFVAPYRDLDVEVITHGMAEPVDEIAEFLRGRVSVLFGHSGVGKSTLVNQLVPEAQRATGDVADLTGKGRHTSSSAVALRLPAGGFVIDTPGVRSLGLAHVTTDQVVGAFADLAEGAEGCPTGCTHMSDEPDCALDRWIADGHAPASRLASLRRLLASRLGWSEDLDR